MCSSLFCYDNASQKARGDICEPLPSSHSILHRRTISPPPYLEASPSSTQKQTHATDSPAMLTIICFIWKVIYVNCMFDDCYQTSFPPSSASNKLYYISFYFCCSSEIGSHYVSLIGLKLCTKPKLAFNFDWTSLTLLGIQTQATKPSLYCLLRLIVFPKPPAITSKVPSLN